MTTHFRNSGTKLLWNPKIRNRNQLVVISKKPRRIYSIFLVVSQRRKKESGLFSN